MVKLKIKKSDILLNDQVIGSVCKVSDGIFEGDLSDIRGRRLAVLAASRKELIKSLTSEVSFLLENARVMDPDHPVRKALGK